VILSSREISAGRHQRLILGNQDNKITALWWWAGEIENRYTQKIACKLTENIYRGNKSLQLEIKALEPKENLDKDFQINKETKNKIKVVDWRNKDLSKIKTGVKNTVYFAEGLKEYDFYPLINRNYCREAKNIVLITIPHSISVLKEIIILTGAEKIILINSKTETKKLKEFLNNFLSLVKYSLQEKNGIFNLEQAAIALETAKITIKRALEFLRAEAMISYEYLSYQELIITKGGEKDAGKSNLSRKNLEKLLKESSAFRRFIKNTEITKIEKLINRKLN